MRKPNVLVLDIETAPIIAAIWDLKIQGYVPANQIIQDRYVLAYGAKWLGSDKVIYDDQRGEGPGNDRRLLLGLKKLLEKADIVVSWNGESFDAKRINARYQILHIKPPSGYRHYDTMKLVKITADHTSNTLDYVSSNVNKKYKKLHHNDYPGFALWRATALADTYKGWQSMKKYNIHDVLSTEEATLNLLAWAPESFPEFYPVSDRALSCGRCGYYGHMKAVQSKLTNRTEFHQYRCTKCGGFQKGKKVK